MNAVTKVETEFGGIAGYVLLKDDVVKLMVYPAVPASCGHDTPIQFFANVKGEIFASDVETSILRAMDGACNDCVMGVAR